MRGVGGKCQVAFGVPLSSAPAGCGSGDGWLDSTAQCAGAVTLKVKVAFRSGCSKSA